MDTEALAASPPPEEQRLRAVRRFDGLHSPADGAFTRVAAIAARSLRAPISTVSIVDRDRIWFRGKHGLELTAVDREPGLCASAILQRDPYVVTDAVSDPRAFDNALVRGELGARFYAAAPIQTSDGYNLGTVNVISSRPRAVTEEETETLQYLAAIVADELETRLAARREAAARRHEVDRLQAVTRQLQEALHTRIVIEQAKGILAERHGEPVAAAFERLRAYARSTQRRIRDVARDVIAGTLEL